MPPASHTLHTAYACESRALCHQAVQATSWLALPLVVLFGVLEGSGVLVAPDYFPVLRAGCAASLAIVLVLCRRPLGQRRPRLLFAVIMASVGLMLTLMTVSTGREQSPYFAGIALVQLAAAILMPWPALWSACGAFGLVVSYTAVMLASGPIANAHLFSSNVSLLVASGVIATVSTALRERLRWREFATRCALADALEHRRDFMAKMSHELRTPLHVIIGYNDILLEECVPPDQVEARALIERSRSSAVTLHRMISELLDYAKVEAGKMDVRPEPIDVRAMVSTVVEGFRPLIERKGLSVDVACDADLPDLLSDRLRLQQILNNLVGNAVKFTQEGGLSIAARVVAGALPGFSYLDGELPPAVADGPQLAILVRDTGVGIAESDLAQLAQDFRQVADAAAGHYGGTGLGLSISRRLAELLGGRIAVCSRPAEGSTFALVLRASVPPCRAAA